MKNVTVKKADLLEVLERNRREHRQIFTDAQKAYRQKVIEELDMMLAEARSGLGIRRMIQLPEPEDHTDDFDTIISMLNMSIEEDIHLMYDEYQQYVMNDWRWAGTFAANTASYVNQ